MEPQSPYKSDNPDEEPLLTPDKFRALRARLRRNSHRSNGVFWVAFILNVVLLFRGIWWVFYEGEKVSWYILSVFLLSVLLTAKLCARIGRADKNDAQCLLWFVENAQSVDQIGAILEATVIGMTISELGGKIYWAMVRTIPRLLLLIQPADADILNTQQRTVLRSHMFGHNPYGDMAIRSGAEYCLPMLSALERIGNKRDLPDVVHLAKIHHITEVRAAAEHCAVVIRERVAREEGKDFLLRADHKPEAVETLLRASTETADTPPQQLLRAAASDETNISA